LNSLTAVRTADGSTSLLADLLGNMIVVVLLSGGGCDNCLTLGTDAVTQGARPLGTGGSSGAAVGTGDALLGCWRARSAIANANACRRADRIGRHHVTILRHRLSLYRGRVVVKRWCALIPRIRSDTGDVLRTVIVGTGHAIRSEVTVGRLLLSKPGIHRLSSRVRRCELSSIIELPPIVPFLVHSLLVTKLLQFHPTADETSSRGVRIDGYHLRIHARLWIRIHRGS
jgi:hypothetical protein